ncbi:23S rRNA methyltransferase [Arsukibacterium sp. MJ3]|jgi:23S rRNA (cytidine2498-2'-O)-methyltransferase|uniref:23S rRNA (cytidine(2498)-2'-O)-methyltransferase RlmM n=1 Tax=Arsukibacterium sp. MJ3 TaxID=1632859 RepID=UPI000626FBBE|nr:23S rRNA (cytidine(2498)-2'-O)-methyltransferase RlmM [Arsukibacterium sp. MJ3]KKO48871.1 23S rRNA methyltransferase [Arsukibacterium sp. MJ3]
MKQLLLYCRAGFEKECAAEIQDKASSYQLFGFCKLVANSAYVIFEAYDVDSLATFYRDFEFNQFIFIRQWCLLAAPLLDLPAADRIAPVLDALQHTEISGIGELRVEFPQTNDGKTLSTLARKFTVPLRQALRQAGVMLQKEQKRAPVLHLFLLSGQQGYLGLSYPENNSPLENGILRLKFPNEAPSRSTLKLEEAFIEFIPRNEWDKRLAPGMLAVDLGACPGGWTYQLVKRSMMVTAIDNGPMAESLMQTGQVKHLMVDGFKFEPKRKNVYWLVCDMIEQPQRVADRIADWIINGWCQESIFNLKLPMKRRYETVQEVLENLENKLLSADIKYQLLVKHLYHDREEVTVLVRNVVMR